jgi:hypothetical protein
MTENETCVSSSKDGASSGWNRLRYVLLFAAVPYLVGYLFSSSNIEPMMEVLSPYLQKVLPYSARKSHQTIQHDTASSTSSAKRVTRSVDFDQCYAKAVELLSTPGKKNSTKHFDQLSIVIHRNGEATPCASVSDNVATALKTVLHDMLESGLECPNLKDKFEIESLLTRLFAHTAASCTSQERYRMDQDSGFYGFCDMGKASTPVLLDHRKLVPIQFRNETLLPCHFHNNYGQRVTSLTKLVEMARTLQCSDDNDQTCALREMHLYAVPAGRVFLHTPSHVGQIIDLPHVTGGDPTKPVYLEVLSIEPAVFDLHNFFTKDESADLVQRALKETRESHRIKRSSTGASGYTINDRRTSESGFDTDGETAIKLKRWVFLVLYGWMCKVVLRPSARDVQIDSLVFFVVQCANDPFAVYSDAPLTF